MVTIHLFGHIINLNGWEATLATFVIAFHDIILWPVMFAIGTMTGRKTVKGKYYPKVSKEGKA